MVHKDWLKFTSRDKPKESLGKKLVEEQRKRKAAEKKAAYWEAKYLKTKKELDEELEGIGPYGDRNPPNW